MSDTASDSETEIWSTIQAVNAVANSPPKKEEEVGVDIPDKSFRLQNKTILLTYRSHLNKDAYITWLRQKVAPKELVFIRLAHENGDDGNYPHTHVLVSFDKIFESKNCRIFDYADPEGIIIHPHIKKVLSRKHFDAAKVYLAKEDPENSDLKTAGKKAKSEGRSSSIVEDVTSLPNVREAVNRYFPETGFTGISGVMSIYRLGQPQLKYFDWVPTQQWELDIVALSDTRSDPREIMWYYDPIGNIGKTALSKWLYVNKPGKWFCSKDMGTSRDAATIIDNAICSGWDGTGFILQLPRSAEEHTRIYAYLEEIKDGMVTSQKYSGRTIVFDTPHVIVFANFLPDTSALSLDRWKICQITKGPDGTVTLSRLTLSQTAQLRLRSAEPQRGTGVSGTFGSGFSPEMPSEPAPTYAPIMPKTIVVPKIPRLAPINH